MKIDKTRELVVYCSQESCDDALKLTKKLRAAGFARVMAFTGGFRAGTKPATRRIPVDNKKGGEFVGLGYAVRFLGGGYNSGRAFRLCGRPEAPGPL